MSQHETSAQCDQASWNSCNWVCNPFAGSDETSCLLDGESTTCGEVGTYPRCGDGVCAAAAGETCGNCSDDCNACPPNTATTAATTIAGMTAEPPSLNGA